MTTPPSRFDRDPDALAWARAKVTGLMARYRKLEEAAKGERQSDLATRFGWAANELQTELAGNGGCVIAAFDERRASLPPAPDREAP